MPEFPLKPLLRIVFPVVIAGLLPLSGCGASQTDVDQLKRRVSTLEKRVRQLEGGGGRITAPRGKAKGKKRRRRRRGRKQPQPGGEGSVEVAGDGLKVVLEADGKRHPVPGKVPEMAYSILASFEEGQEVEKVGSVKVPADKTVTVKCSSATASCAGVVNE